MLLALLIAAQTYGPQHLPPVTEAEDPLAEDLRRDGSAHVGERRDEELRVLAVELERTEEGGEWHGSFLQQLTNSVGDGSFSQAG